MKKIIPFLSIFCIASLLVAESFILKKQKKKLPSSARLKEDIGDCLGSLLKATTSQLQELVALQKNIITHSYHLLNQDKDCFLGLAKQKELHNCHEELESMKQEMKSIYKRLQKCNTVLQNDFSSIAIQKKI